MGVNIINSGKLVKEIKTQAQKAATVAGWMILSGETNIWVNKQNKKIYKATVRPIMIYSLETRTET